MKMKKIAITVLLLFLINQILISQEYQVPKNVKLDNLESYKNYEQNVLQGINWLEDTKIDQQLEKRKETSAFLLRWITGTPIFSIGLQAFQVELTEKNSDLLISFLGGWTKFALENPTEKDNLVLANMAGILSIIKVYSFNKENGIKKDKKIERLIDLSQIELEKWIKNQLE